MSKSLSSAAPRPFVYAPPEDSFLSVIHADDDILVIDKPAGLLTVAGKDPSLSDCLASRAQSRFAGALIVHRLDKDTSGVIILGLTPKAHAYLGLQFEKRDTQKTYIARVLGEIAADSGTIDAPLMTDWPNRPKQHVDWQTGRSAVTHWEVLKRENGTTRVKLTPLTGRSHQLRVHMMHIGHPILGDNLYAPEEGLHAADRLQLHAQSLTIRHPNGGKPQKYETKCPF